MFEVAREAVTLTGALAGLWATGYIIYERLVRDRPLVSVHRRLLPGGGTSVLRIVNTAADDLIILKVAAQPERFLAIAIDDSVAGISRGTRDGFVVDVHVGAGLQAQLPLFPLEKAGDAPDTPVRITVQWQRSRRIWPVLRRTSITTTPAFVNKIENAPSVSRDAAGKKP